MTDEDMFNGLFEAKYQIDKKETVKRSKTLLKEYKTIAQIASVTKVPSMTQSFVIGKPRFSVGQFLEDSQDKNQINKAVEKQMIAQGLVTDIINGLNKLYVKSGEPSAYYRCLLYFTYLDFSVKDNIEARIKLAKEFPRRIDTVPNDIMLDEHIFYFDLNKALLGFAHSYCSNETNSLLIFKNENTTKGEQLNGKTN